MQWFRYYHEALDDPKVQQLSADEFKRQFMAAIYGEENAFSRFIDGPFYRPDSHEWRALRQSVFERDGFTCQYCGAARTQLECDHKTPVSRGGSSEPHNLVTACRDCNRAKGARTAEEFQGAV